MGNLPAPIRSKLFERYGSEYYQTSVCAMQGFRTSMEDQHLIKLSLTNHPQYSLFAIFDGHNGMFELIFFIYFFLLSMRLDTECSENKRVRSECEVLFRLVCVRGRV